MIVYHGTKKKVEFPEIRISKNNKDGKTPRAAFWELAKFSRPTHQISFHTARALETLKFIKYYEVGYEKR